MDSLLYEFKNAWNRPNNALPQIIIINVVVFVILGVLSLISLDCSEYIINKHDHKQHENEISRLDKYGYSCHVSAFNDFLR